MLLFYLAVEHNLNVSACQAVCDFELDTISHAKFISMFIISIIPKFHVFRCRQLHLMTH
jgi:hypothetical protein